jgi:hypothetical protein
MDEVRIYSTLHFNLPFDLLIYLVSAKACQKAKIPEGPTKVLSVTVVNKAPL